jgi:membrane protein YdbS with pleckstrin-like domain
MSAGRFFGMERHGPSSDSKSSNLAVTPLTIFGLFAVTAMLICYALEARSRWFILAFAAACVLGSVYGFLQGAWPFGLVEAVWSGVAIRRWALAARSK